MSPLYVALCNGKGDAASLLIRRGADLEARTNSGSTMYVSPSQLR